jgi:hypothetical protein
MIHRVKQKKIAREKKKDKTKKKVKMNWKTEEQKKNI